MSHVSGRDSVAPRSDRPIRDLLLHVYACVHVVGCDRAVGAGAKCWGASMDGGKPSTHEGDWLAFGCTREDIRRTALGCEQRGAPGMSPLDHGTGEGYVAAHRGQYHDALSCKQARGVGAGGRGHRGA